MKYYVAYGSNLNREQMAHRCPEAKLVGTGMLSNYEMVFRGNKSNAVATVEPKKGMEVPVGIWEISENDEHFLDRYEGYPHLYEKKNLRISNGTITTEAMVYVMNDGYEYGVPGKEYYEIIKQGYKDCSLDEKYLDEAVEKMKETVLNQTEAAMYPYSDGISFNHNLVTDLFEGNPISELTGEMKQYVQEIQDGLVLIDSHIDKINQTFTNGSSLNIYQVKGYFIGYMVSSQHKVFSDEMAEAWVNSFTEGEEVKVPTSVNAVIYASLEKNLNEKLLKDTKKSMETCYGALIGNDGKTVTTLSKEQMDELIKNMPEDTSEIRKKIVMQAADAVGKIPYYWGGSAKCAGYDGNDFGVTVAPDSKGRNKKGLDCSHFVDWVYWTVMNNNLGNTNTSGQIKMCKKIAKQDLKAGDLAFLINKSGKTTHVGIYAGNNAKGEAVWIHENSNDSNVAMNTVSYWSGYYRLNMMEGR